MCRPEVLCMKCMTIKVRTKNINVSLQTQVESVNQDKNMISVFDYVKKLLTSANSDGCQRQS